MLKTSSGVASRISRLEVGAGMIAVGTRGHSPVSGVFADSLASVCKRAETPSWKCSVYR